MYFLKSIQQIVE